MTTKRISIPEARKAGEMTVDVDGRYDGFADPDVVYIGRALKWTNNYALDASDWRSLYSASKFGREEAVRLYRKYLLEDRPDLRARLGELEGKTLACWRPPDKACHADVLIGLIVTAYRAPTAVAEGVDDCEYSADEFVAAWELGDEDHDSAGPDSAQWWIDHGISPEVREARPYERWRADDPESPALVVRRFEGIVDEKSLKNVGRKAKRSDGVIINRNPFPEHPQLSDPRVAPEIRPDKPVYGKVENPLARIRGPAGEGIQVLENEPHRPEREAQRRSTDLSTNI